MEGMTPIISQTSPVTPSEAWPNIDPEQSMRRRRIRKRKRRPQLAEQDDLEPQEIVYTYSEEPQPQQENIERPRRRRKKTDFQNPDDKDSQASWNEEVNRPKRRRGQKRKRPLAESWPELSEFGGHGERTDDGSEETTKNPETQIENIQDDEKGNEKDTNEKSNSKVQIHYTHEPEIEVTTQTITNYDGKFQAVQKDEDRSLSEFSIESVRQYEIPNRTDIDVQDKIREKGINNIEPLKVINNLLFLM